MGRSCVILGLAVCAVGGSACGGLGSAIAQPGGGESGVPTPASVIGHEVGADYKLARWETIVDYFKRLDAASDRVRVRQIGVSTGGNPMLVCAISAPETLRRIDRYKALNARLHDPRLIADEAERERVLAEAKTTVIVTCGLHSSEVAASQMSMELAYDLATGDDPRTLEILDNCIVLLVPSANPDGNDQIIDWYEKYLGTPFEGGRMPWLYQKYGGHDNNRDWYMLNLKETRVVTELLYFDWRPTILHDVHQMGNRSARFFVPPFFDPVNPNVDPLIHQSLLIIGGHMATELQENNKTGVVFRAMYDNWWAGGNRTTPYRHNMVGILTEAAGVKIASPVFQEYRQLGGSRRGLAQYAPAVNFAAPWPGGWWRLRDIVEYEKIACRSLFTLAARYRDRFIRNHLTLSEQALKKGRTEPPFAWLVPLDQRDPGAAAHMLETLRLTGIEVHRATAPFKADNTEYPAGTHVMLTSQPYRAHLKDMMERQIYPDRRQYPGGPAESPYDSAGWTLSLQMGVRSVEVVRRFDATLAKVERPGGSVAALPADGSPPRAWITRRFGNGDFAALNALLADGFDVVILRESHDGHAAGSAIVTGEGAERQAELRGRVAALVSEHSCRFEKLSTLPDSSKCRKMTAPRTALYQPWTASMDEGWTRFVLERFDFPYVTVHNAEIRAGNLRRHFDCILIPDLGLRSILDGASDKSMPPPYAGGIGADGAMQLERFVRAGGTLVLMDSATALATDLFRAPVRNVLDGVASDKFFCPGSVLRIRVDNTHPLGYGFDDEAAAFFNRSQAFEIGKAALKNKGGRGAGSEAPGLTDAMIDAKAAAQPVTSVATYSDNVVLLSGWILGEDHVRNRTAVAEVGYGEGRIVLLGFRVQHRGQPWGTFKFLFNAIYASTLSGR